MFAVVVASSASAGPVRATATTGPPASANARAIPRPKPRLAPTTTVVLPDSGPARQLVHGLIADEGHIDAVKRGHEALQHSVESGDDLGKAGHHTSTSQF